jgi:hypothetical protein
MAISINWLTKVISIPQSYLTLISGIRYNLDIEKFRNDLKNLEDTEEGLPYSDTHARNKPVTLSGVQYAQTFEVLAPYTISFENTGTPYVVVATGANHNIGDVTNFDGGMSLVVGNSGGLIINTVNIGGGVGTVAEVADAVWNAVASSFNIAGSTGNKLNSAGSSGDPWSADLSIYNTNGTAGKIVKDAGLDITTIKNNTDTLESAVAGLPSAVDIRTEIDTNSTKLTTIVSQTDTLETAIGTAQSDLTTIKGYTDTLETSATSLQTTANTIAGYTDTLETSVGAIKAVTDTLPTAANIAEAVRTELTPELTHITTLQNGQGLDSNQAIMLLELFKLSGLDPTKPLIVTKTSRIAGDISQSITGDANSTTVTRV